MKFPSLDDQQGSSVDAQLSSELRLAGIRVADSQEVNERPGEIQTRVFGHLHLWRFRRAKNYWICSGPGIDANSAEQLWLKHGTTVRADGHAGSPNPKAWFKGLGCGLYHVDDAVGLRALAQTLAQIASTTQEEAAACG